MIDVNLTAPFELGFEASTFAIEQRSGKGITIASAFSLLGGQPSPAYAATNQRVLDHIQANAWGQVADLTGATAFVVSCTSDQVNGPVLPVDGGHLVR